MSLSIEERAKRFLEHTANQLRAISLGADFVDVVDLLTLQLRKGSTIFSTGVGKSFLVAEKFSKTLNLYGMRGQALHATEILHGDGGGIQGADILVAFSRSGSTREVQDVLRAHIMVPSVLVTCSPDPGHGSLVTLMLSLGEIVEAAEDRLAPTTSHVAMQTVGDALVCSIAQEARRTAADVRSNHPAGSLGI